MKFFRLIMCLFGVGFVSLFASDTLSQEVDEAIQDLAHLCVEKNITEQEVDEVLGESFRAIHVTDKGAHGSVAFPFANFFAGNFFIATNEESAQEYSVNRVVSNNESFNVIPLAENELLNDQKFDAMTLLNNRFPVVARKFDAGDDGSLNKIILIEQDGAKVVPNTDRLYDTRNPVVEIKDKSAVALAASKDTIFVLVPPDGGNFGGPNSGLIRLKRSNDGASLRTVSLQNGSLQQAPAYKIDTTPVTGDPNNLSVHFGSITSILGQQATMWWDDHLERLFIGFTGVGLQTTTDTGTIVFCLVGRIQDVGGGGGGGKRLVLEPVLTVPAVGNSFADQPTKDYAVALRSDGTNNTLGSLFHIRTMHTSTGRSYLIGNGGVVGDPGQAAVLNTRVFALPLVQQNVAGTIASNDIGAIAGKNNPADRPVNSADVPFVRTIDLTTGLATGVEYAHEVGANQRYLDHGVNSADQDKVVKITDMQVVGDTVYVSLAGPRSAEDAPGEQGIFASRALFNVDGAIITWTPWERVMGRIENVFSFGLDPFSQRFFYTTGSLNDSTAPLRVKVTKWGLGDEKTFNQDGLHNTVPLSKALDGISSTNPVFGPVYGLVNFDDETPGFLDKNKRDAFPDPSLLFGTMSLFVATGHEKVALIQTGFEALGSNNLFKQVIEFNYRKFPYSDDGEEIIDSGEIARTVIIKECPGLGDIVTAELSRIPAHQVTSPATHERGWVFVGGEKGVAVLSNAQGDGWNTEASNPRGLGGLQALDDSFGDTPIPGAFPGGSDWTFKKLKRNTVTFEDSFPDTRKLVSDGKFLYIVTKNKVWRITLDDVGANAGFKGGSPGNLATANNCTLIADATSAMAGGAPDNFVNAEFTDLMVINKNDDNRQFLLMTNKGMWMNTQVLSDNGQAGGMSAIQVLLWERKLEGDIVQAQFFGEKRGTVFGSFDSRKDQKLAHGNLYVTAIQNQQAINVYRFQVRKQDSGNLSEIVKFNEQYKDGAVATEYFYRLGSLVRRSRPDFSSNINEFVGCAFNGVPVTPNPNYFLNAGKDNSKIDLGLNLTKNTCILPITHDTASGASYVYGAFGVRVNE